MSERTLESRLVLVVALVACAACGELERPSVRVVPRFDRPDAAGLEAERRRAPTDGDTRTDVHYTRALAQRRVLRRHSSGSGRLLPGSRFDARAWMTAGLHVLDAWTPLGPGNIGGRTRVVRFHPTRPSTLVAAGVSGGVFRSDDEGGSWRPTGDGLTNFAVNALAIDRERPDTMYVGTGEGFLREEIRGTGLPLRGNGIYATQDGGATWTQLASTANANFLWVNDLELGIGDTRRIYAATRSGVWRSLDAGATWSPLLETSVRGGCLDLALRPDRTDDVLFAACGSYEQSTVYRFVGASGSARAEPVLSEPGMGRTSLAIAPSQPDVIYALAASNDPGPRGEYRQGLHGVYRSDRGGAEGSWQPRVTNQDSIRLHTLLLTNSFAASLVECGQGAVNQITTMGWYNNVIAVDPRDPDRVWAAGVDWFRSDDGGFTWGIASTMSGQPGTTVAFAHVDQHAIAFHPGYDGTANQVALIGNDGGVYRTRNARAATSRGARGACPASTATIQVRWETLNRDLGITQFYHGVPFPDGSRYIGGTQDNGTILGGDDIGVNGWRTINGGDGTYSAVDFVDPQIIYAQFQWSNLAKSTNGGVTFTAARRGLDPIRADSLGPEGNYLFVTPLAMDPSDSRRLWLGGEFLYRTTDGAGQWIKASTAMRERGLVSALAVHPSDPSRVIAGTHNGFIVTSGAALAATALTEWSAARPRAGWVTSLAFDPRAAGVVYATYGNFGGTHVYRSADNGATWQPLDGGGDGPLPDIPVHSIVVDPDEGSRLYLGTDLGVFVSTDGGSRWLVEETGFGPAVTEWLSLVRDPSGRRRLFAFTHGRGAWRVDLR
jgi:hypothetical protein